MTRAWWMGMTAVITLMSTVASEGATKKERVAAHKTKAFQLFEAGDYRAGIAEMEKAYALIPHPGFLLNIAVAYDRWPGHCAESLETFERFFSECDGCKLAAKAKKQHEDIEGACRVPVSIRSTPDGADVAIDGAVRGKTPFTVRLLPGRYAIVADLEGHTRAMNMLYVERATPGSLALNLVPNAQSIASEPPPPPPPHAAPPPPVRIETPVETASGPSPFTWVAFGVGAAGVGTGVAFSVLTKQAVDREEEARLTPLPKAEIEAIQREAQRDAILAYVGYGIGVAGVATGVLLLLFTGGEEPELAAAIGPGTIGVTGRF
jgi:hypothetical protein